LVFGVLPLPAADTSVPDLPKVTAGEHSNRVHQAYIEWTGRFAQDKTNSETAWRFARTCFQRADFSINDTQRAAFAELGIAASKHAIKLDTNSAAGYFYLGVNLGQLARTKLFSALGLLDEMEVAWEKSIALDPKFHYAAADRSLGLLYLDAPGWPISLGSRSKARKHLQQAARLVPEYPENHLCWLEAQLKWGEAKSVRAQLAVIGTLLQAARTNFTGTAWSRDWEDWDVRWKRIRAKCESTVNARSPRDAR
jgi:tetratricopeptide (TPR) repeat protein